MTVGLRLAILSYEFPPFFGGGIATFAANLADLLAQRGVEVHVVTNESRGKTGSFEKLANGICVHRSPLLTDGLRMHPESRCLPDERSLFSTYCPSLYYSRGMLPLLERVIAEHQIQVVEAAECFAEAYAFLHQRETQGRNADVACNITLHSPIFEIFRHNRWNRLDPEFERRRAMEDDCIRWADTLCSPSRNLRDLVLGRIAPNCTRAGTCSVIPYPFPFDETGDEEFEPLPDGVPFLLCPGRLEPRKGQQTLVAALRRLDEMGHQPHVVFVGGEDRMFEMPMREFLLESAGAVAGRLHFLGKMPREKLLACYRHAMATVCPAPWDNYPNTCIESMAAGTPVIGGNNSGMAEMIEHGVSGWLFQADSSLSLASVLRQVLEDPTGRAEVGRCAGEHIRQLLNPDHIAAKQLEQYQNARETRRHANSTSDARMPSKGGNGVFCIRLGTNLVTDDTTGVDGIESRGIPFQSGTHATPMEECCPDLAEVLLNGHHEFIVIHSEHDELQQSFFTQARDALLSNPQAGGVACWLRSLNAEYPHFQAMDFQPRLLWIDGWPPPCFMVRRSDLQSLNLAWHLPPKFWLLDLVLSLWAKNREFLVLQEFLGTFDRPFWSLESLIGKYTRRHYLFELLDRHASMFDAVDGIWAGRFEVEDATAESVGRFRAVLGWVQAAGAQNIAVYPAGQHTRGILPELQDAPIRAIVDDRAAEMTNLLGWQVVPPDRAGEVGIDAVIVCTDTYEDLLWRRAARLGRQGIAVYRMYGNRNRDIREAAMRWELAQTGDMRLAVVGRDDDILDLWPVLLEYEASFAGIAEMTPGGNHEASTMLGWECVSFADLTAKGVQTVLNVSPDLQLPDLQSILLRNLA